MSSIFAPWSPFSSLPWIYRYPSTQSLDKYQSNGSIGTIQSRARRTLPGRAVPSNPLSSPNQPDDLLPTNRSLPCTYAPPPNPSTSTRPMPLLAPPNRHRDPPPNPPASTTQSRQRHPPIPAAAGPGPRRQPHPPKKNPAASHARVIITHLEIINIPARGAREIRNLSQVFLGDIWCLIARTRTHTRTHASCDPPPPLFFLAATGPRGATSPRSPLVDPQKGHF